MIDVSGYIIGIADRFGIHEYPVGIYNRTSMYPIYEGTLYMYGTDEVFHYDYEAVVETESGTVFDLTSNEYFLTPPIPTRVTEIIMEFVESEIVKNFQDPEIAKRCHIKGHDSPTYGVNTNMTLYELFLHYYPDIPDTNSNRGYFGKISYSIKTQLMGLDLEKDVVYEVLQSGLNIFLKRKGNIYELRYKDLCNDIEESPDAAEIILENLYG